METRYYITLQAADGRTRNWNGTAPSEAVACTRAIRDIKRETPIDSKGKASEWRVLKVG